MSNIQQPFKIAVAGVALFAEIGLRECRNLGVSAYYQGTLQETPHNDDPRWVLLGANSEYAYYKNEIPANCQRTIVTPVLKGVRPLWDPTKDSLVEWNRIQLAPLVLLLRCAEIECGKPPSSTDRLLGYLRNYLNPKDREGRQNLVEYFKQTDQRQIYNWEIIQNFSSGMEQILCGEGNLPGMRK